MYMISSIKSIRNSLRYVNFLNNSFNLEFSARTDLRFFIGCLLNIIKVNLAPTYSFGYHVHLLEDHPLNNIHFFLRSL